MNNDTPQPTVKESLPAQKPRCPWPVHEWPKEAALAVHYEKRVFFKDANEMPMGVMLFVGEHQEEPINYTRAEALASQMRPAPDKVGVWAIYSNGIHFRSNYFSDITVDYIDTSEDEIGYPNKRMEVVDSRGGYYTLGAFQFYYMGPLPTVDVDTESEVVHE